MLNEESVKIIDEFVCGEEQKKRLRLLEDQRRFKDETDELQKHLEEKEYNEKVSDCIFGTGQRPSVVGKVKSDNPAMDYEFVDFKKIQKKEPMEYVDSNMLDYDMKVDISKEPIPTSFLMIKEGEIEKGKDWYLKHDPKLPTEIAEMMARYNWGDLKFMTKKNAKHQRKKLKHKGKDLGIVNGLSVRHATKNNPILVEFD